MPLVVPNKKLSFALYHKVKAQFGWKKDTEANRQILSNYITQWFNKRTDDYEDLRDVDFMIIRDFVLEMCFIPNDYEIQAQRMKYSDAAIKRYYNAGNPTNIETCVYKLSPLLWAHWYKTAYAARQ